MGSQDHTIDSEKLAQMLSEGTAVGVDFDTTDIEFLYHYVDHRGECFAAGIDRENRPATMEEEMVILRLASLHGKLASMLGQAREEDTHHE